MIKRVLLLTTGVLVALGVLLVVVACQPMTVIVQATPVPVTPVALTDSLGATYLGSVNGAAVYRFVDKGNTCYLAIHPQGVGIGCPVGGGR